MRIRIPGGPIELFHLLNLKYKTSRKSRKQRRLCYTVLIYHETKKPKSRILHVMAWCDNTITSLPVPVEHLTRIYVFSIESINTTKLKRTKD